LIHLFESITFWGGATLSNIYFTNINITGGTYAVLVNGISGSAYFTNVVATNLSKGGIYSCDASFNLVQVSGDKGWNDTHC